MANELNILPANFENNSEFLFVDDPEIWIKILDDASWTEFKPLGYAHLEKSFTIEKEYAEFKTGIPETLVDKVIIGVKRFFKCKVAQLQPETIAMISDGIVDARTSETYVHYGTEAPTSIAMSIILKGKTRNGKALELRIRKAIPSSDSIEFALGAKEYGGMEFKAEIVRDDNPLVTNFDWHCLGEQITTASTTSASKDITVASATGLAVGMYAYGDGIAEGSIVEEVDGTTISLSIAATKTGASVDVKFITRENLLKSNVAYWISEK